MLKTREGNNQLGVREAQYEKASAEVLRPVCNPFSASLVAVAPEPVSGSGQEGSEVCTGPR